MGSQVVSWLSCVEPEIAVFEGEAKKVALGGELRERFFLEHAKSHGNLVDD